MTGSIRPLPPRENPAIDSNTLACQPATQVVRDELSGGGYTRPAISSNILAHLASRGTPLHSKGQ